MFSKKKDIDDLEVEKRMTQLQLVNFIQISKSRNLFIVLVFFFLLSFFQLEHYYTWCIALGVLLIHLLYVKIYKRSLIHKLINLDKQMENLSQEIDQDEGVQEYLDLLNMLEAQHQIPDMVRKCKRSFLCRVFDKLFRFNVNNKKCLICPRCGGNNGLCDNPQDAKYYCSYCESYIGGEPPMPEEETEQETAEKVNNEEESIQELPNDEGIVHRK